MADYLDRAVADGYAKLSRSGKSRITYVAAGHTDVYDDPEEQVRAEFWAELIYRYGYEPQRIGIEITVPDRTPNDVADIVVFNDDARTDPFAVIECKRDGITDAEFLQAVEQAAGNGTWAKLRALYVGVVAGLTRRFLDFGGTYGALEREKNIIADLPAQYGMPEEFKYTKGGSLDIEPVSKETLIQAIRKSHQTLWAGGKLSPPQAFGELCKLIFVKIADEQAKRKRGEPYQFQIKTHETSKRLSGRIRALYAEHQKRDPNVFTDTIRIEDETIRTIVSHLEAINLSATDLDVKGVAFEQFMDGFFKGDFGQYFTPREVIQFAVEIIEPTSDDRVLDPACGSGGFLLYAMDAVRREAVEYYPDVDSVEHYKHWHNFAEKQLFGIEINDEICRVAKMNMIIHDDGHSNVMGEDALRSITALTKRNPGFTAGSFDVVLTNPPFGASVELAAQPYLAEYTLGKTKPDAKGRQKTRKNQRTEILFLERMWDFLRPNGHAAIVLPDGVLNNPSNDYVREFLLERFQILAVVSLPATAFAHFGAGVKASIAFLRKRADGEIPNDDEVTFMAAPEKIGYDATGRKTDNELPKIAEAYRKFAKSPTRFLA
jgi:type I restriction enzyme M protein